MRKTTFKIDLVFDYIPPVFLLLYIIFLERFRAIEAIETGWAVAHPFAVEQQDASPDPGAKQWEGFVMLFTPQSIDELNVTFQLIVDSFNYVTGQELIATDFYD